MRYTFMGYTYYDYAPAIKLRIQQFMLEGSNVYIPLFTRAVIADRYPAPDDGFTFEIASDLSDAIRWLAVNKGIIIGTETAEWIIPPGVTAVNVQAALNSQYGSDAIQGTVINDAACFFQSGKKALVEYYIPQQDNNFRANNMALLSARLLAESPAAEFDYIRSPYTKLFITRADGQVVTLLYERSTGVFAWGRISTAGAVQSVAVLPGADGNDDVYLVVKRAGQYFLERLREAAEVYLDSFQRWTGANEDYADTAVIVDADGEQWIGYPYTSLIRTMPVLANNQLKKQRITTLLFRFLRSFLPTVSAIAGGRRIQTDLITNLKTPYSGIHRIPFPGTWDEDVQIELTCDKPEPVRILALNAEVQ
jgi:hypothetical protein